MPTLVYLAADEALREVASDDAASGFCATRLESDEECVKRQFKKVSFVFAGSYERSESRAGLRNLAAYLREEVSRVGAIELYACHDGQQESSSRNHRVLCADDFEADGFFFLEKELSVVCSVSPGSADPK
jgi:hypothetical protein